MKNDKSFDVAAGVRMHDDGSVTELADFVENAVEGLHRVGSDGTILWANRAELQMLGYRWEEYVGRHIAEFHADPSTIDHILATLLAGGALYDSRRACAARTARSSAC